MKLTIKEAAEVLNLEKNELEFLLRTGKIPFTKWKNSKAIDEKDLLKYQRSSVDKKKAKAMFEANK